MTWSDQQRHLLRALGYAVYERAPSPAALLATATNTAAAGSGSLLRALRLAAMGADVSRWVADLAALRDNPSAKRALWPKLRALRRASAPDRVDDR
jgi:hypothetical protein